MQTPNRILSPFGLMNEVNRTYSSAAPFINRYANQEHPVRLFSDDNENDYSTSVRIHTVDPRYALRRVDNNKIDYSMCVDTDDEKTC